MNALTENAHGDKIYLVTLDLGDKISQIVGVKSPSSDDAFYAQIQDDLIGAIQLAIGHHAVVQTVQMSELSKEVLSLAKQLGDVSQGTVVSTCREFTDIVKGTTLDINRLVDFDGNTIGIGPRPGCANIAEQVEDIKYASKGKPIVIVEDGVFSGGTIRYVVDILKKAGVEVSNIIVGFIFPSSSDNINWLEENGVKVSWLKEFGELMDWVPDHDFLPLVPNCGKVIGVSPFGNPVPYYDREGFAFSVPYVFPFGPVGSWASIPEENKRALAKKCLSLSLQVYSKLDSLNGRKIKLKELAGAPQPATIPVTLGHRNKAINAEKPVTDFLNDLSHSVASELYK